MSPQPLCTHYFNWNTTLFPYDPQSIYVCHVIDFKAQYLVNRTFRNHGSIRKVAPLIKSFPTVQAWHHLEKNVFGAFGHVASAHYDVIMADLGVALAVFETPSTCFTYGQNFMLSSQNEQFNPWAALLLYPDYRLVLSH